MINAKITNKQLVYNDVLQCSLHLEKQKVFADL